MLGTRHLAHNRQGVRPGLSGRTGAANNDPITQALAVVGAGEKKRESVMEPVEEAQWEPQLEQSGRLPQGGDLKWLGRTSHAKTEQEEECLQRLPRGQRRVISRHGRKPKCGCSGVRRTAERK